MSESLEIEDLLFVNKPSGIPTHRPHPDRQGFVEWWQRKQSAELKICQRLDKETSGAMMFAKSKQAATVLTNMFAERKVEKEYLFISTEKSKLEEWWVIEKKAEGALVKEHPGPKEGEGAESLTRIVRVSSHDSLYLYKAFPKTGKTHQIRKHATQSGIPILGDDEYGGSTFPRLMLHCRRLELPWQGETLCWEVPPSRLFENIHECLDLQWSRWVLAYERRQILFPEKLNSQQALRVFHEETGDLRGEQVGEKMILGWWSKQRPTEAERQKIKKLMDTFDIRQWVFQWRPGAQDPDSTTLLLNSADFVTEDWHFWENEVQYLGSLDRGQNFGLFLDQRDRRKWVKDHGQGKKVLNLFAFTCGFSLNAALGGADQVVSVDLYRKYLDWGKENFQINGIDPNQSQYEWRAMDSLEYLEYALRKKRRFDIIICDPPSFSRHKKSKKKFSVEKDYKRLLDLCEGCLAPGGTLLFSTNFEKWSWDQWQKALAEWGGGSSLHSLQTSPSQWDYEWQASGANLKAFFLKNA